MKHRYQELDLLRTLAILLMAIYHTAFDLESYYGWKIGVFEDVGWNVFRQGTASLFLMIVGISFAISWNRHHAKHEEQSFGFRYRKYLLRGLGVIACGMLISAATYAWVPETYVRFGILHVIGASILLLPFFACIKEGNAVIGATVIGLMMIVPAVTQTYVLIPLGIPPPDFFSVDYFPLIPWFGVVLIGYAIGFLIYVRNFRRTFSSPPAPVPSPAEGREGPWMRAIIWPGRNALIIYLIHQPLILGILALVARAHLL